MRKFINDWDRKNPHLMKGTHRGALTVALLEREAFEATIQPIPASFWPWTHKRLEKKRQPLLDRLAVLEGEVVRCEQEWKEYTIHLAEIKDSATPF